MSDLITAAVPEGGFQAIRDIKGSPVPKEIVLQNIRDSADFPFPLMTKKPACEGSLIFVAGGPTLLDHIDEIRDRSKNGEYILTSNNTYDFLVSHGIIPNGCLIFDPKKRVAGYVTNPQMNTTFFLGVTVVRAVFERFAGFNVQKVLIVYGMEGEEDLNLQQALYPLAQPKDYLVGGTMTPLRAMPFACMMGYKSIDYYGMDSCFSTKQPMLIMEGDPGYYEALLKAGRCYEDTDTGKKSVIAEPDEGGYFYAYKKDRPQDDIHIAEVGQRRFVTSPAFSHQAKQFIYWMNRLEGKIEIAIHGDSMTAALVLAERMKKEHLANTIGNRRWTDEYAALQQDFYSEAEHKYGSHGDRHFELVARALVGMYGQRRKEITWLDYGCGRGALGKEVSKALSFVKVTNYDPFHPNWIGKPDPEPHDFVTCMDVMEHVEEQCIDNTLKFIAERTLYGAMFLIGTTESLKTLPDGRNAHITIKTSQWWKEKLSNYFQVTEQASNGYWTTIVAVAIGSSQRLEEERKAA